MFDQLLEESVTEAETLTSSVVREQTPLSLGATVGAAVTKAARSLPADAMLVAFLAMVMMPDKSRLWWAN